MTAGAATLLPIVSLQLRVEHDVALARQRARQIAGHAGVDTQSQVRFATAVSELARNAFQYAGGGRISFLVEPGEPSAVLLARVQDNGPGIPHLREVLSGTYKSRTGMGLGILGARRLSDRFSVECEPGKGTDITIGKTLPAGREMGPRAVAEIGAALAGDGAQSPYEELQRQNQELLSALDQLREGASVVERLTGELAETNRGVVALYRELDERAELLQRMSETKTRFLSDMSHELRTPLTSIINLSRLLLAHTDGPLNDEQTRQVSLVTRSAESLVEMVNDLLDIARIEAGHVELRIGSFDVGELFAALRSMFRPLAVNERVELVFEEPAEPIAMCTDEQRVAQVLRNFISNALKFTSAGEVRVTAASEAEHVRFTVRDTGAGIAPEELQRIFEEFTQVDGPIQRRVKGTGLGLPLSRKLAAILHGEVVVESAVGEGSAFSLVVPATLPSDGAHG